MESNETKNRREQVLEAALNGVEKFLNSYIEDDRVLEYIYEGDVQAALYSSIKKSLEGHCEFNYKKKWFINKKLNTKTQTPCLVHCEQHFKGEKDNRIDIVIWDPTDENAVKDYKYKDLLLLIEIKYCTRSNKKTVRIVKHDYCKLMSLLKEYQRGLALTFTADKSEKLQQEGKPIDVCDILKEKPIQGLVVCRDGIIEIPI